MVTIILLVLAIIVLVVFAFFCFIGWVKTGAELLGILALISIIVAACMGDTLYRRAVEYDGLKPTIGREE